MNSRIIKYILRLFLVWQIILIILSVVSPKILTKRERFMYNDGVNIINPIFLWNRANFDGFHYLGIAEGGYGKYQQAFFPFYPRLIKIFTPIFNGMDLVAGVIISNISLIAALFIFYKLILLDFKEKDAKKTLLYLMAFSTSFYFGMVYTESLFLMLVLGSFYAARKKWWLLSGILGAFASSTRIVGVFIFPALIFEWYEQSNKINFKSSIKSFLPILIVPLGLLSYMKFLWQTYGDPLLFMHVQSDFGAGRSGGKIILLYQVCWRYLKMILTTKMDFLYYSVWLELLISLLFLIILFLGYKKGIRKSYLIFSIFAFIVPTLSGTFLSMPRFVLILFPCFLYFGLIKNKYISNILIVIFIITLLISSILFFQGYWVA